MKLVHSPKVILQKNWGEKIQTQPANATLKNQEPTVNLLTPISNTRLDRNSHEARGKGHQKQEEKASRATGTLRVNYSGFLKSDCLAELNIQPGRITVVPDGAKTMGLALRFCSL